MLIKTFISEIEKAGFERVLEIPFISLNEKYNEEFYVYFCRKHGIVLQFDSNISENLNGGQYYYQWMPSDEFLLETERKFGYRMSHHNALSSGGFDIVNKQFIWTGYGDCRNTMLARINELKSDGFFITPWVKTCHTMTPTFIHYGDHQCAYNAPWSEEFELYNRALEIISPKRFKMLPKFVKDAIKGNMSKNKMVERKVKNNDN